MEKKKCAVSGKELPLHELVPIPSVSDTVLSWIRKEHPDLPETGYISNKVLNEYRQNYVQKLLADENGELNTLESAVMDSIKNAHLLSKRLADENTSEKATFGQRLADKIASFGGSWTFIIIFMLFILAWMIINIIALFKKPFDPFPFILLNLMLSCLAALQAPVIMMSQNRQEAKDRKRAQHDYQVNLKAELEIQQLHEKIDHLMIHQGERLLEIQQIQTEMLKSIMERLEIGHNKPRG